FPHESFWVAVSAAAPVIALAAVVGLTDQSGESTRTLEWIYEHPADLNEADQYVFNKNMVQFQGAQGARLLLGQFNTFLQTLTLIFSLHSLASRADFVPVLVAVILEAVGMELTMFSSTATALPRRAGTDSSWLQRSAKRHRL